MDYYPWVDDTSDNLAWLADKSPASIADEEWRISTGESVASWFPADVVFDLSRDDGIELADSIPNTSSIKIVSEKLRGILAATGAPFEFFPVRIRNHKRKIVPQRYYLANLLGLLSCMDRDRSDFDLSAIDKRVRRFRRLVLDESKIPKGTQIFRLADDRDLYIASYDLAALIKKEQKCTGLIFKYMEDFGMEWRGRDWRG